MATENRPRLGPNDRLLDEAFAAVVLPRRSFGAHKWGVGGLVIVAGAPHFAGAAALCAMAAGRAGAGIVNVAVPPGVSGVVTAAVPEAATILLPSGDSPGAGRRAAEAIAEKVKRSTAIVVGPGLGEDEAAHALLAALFGGLQARQTIGFGSGASDGASAKDGAAAGLLAKADKPLVIDADGLNWLAKQPDWPEMLPRGRAVLTPHVGEMARLLGGSADDVIADPVETVRAAARMWGQVVVLKYGFTAASDGQRTVVAADAPLSLATAGSGDVFAGVIGAFLAQGVEPLAAAGLAIYVGARAARRVERRTGTLGLVASDLPLAVAEELAMLEGTARDG